MKIQIFDPPMCCSTGVCGPSINPKLVQFAADVAWLATHDIAVDRFNLSQQPAAFVENPLVKNKLANAGEGCLPLILVDGVVRSEGRYLNREELSTLANIAFQEDSSPREMGKLIARVTLVKD